MQQVVSLYRKAYSGLAPSTWWLSSVMLINRSGTMVVPFLTLYLTKNLHYSLSSAGLVMAIFGIGAVCGGFAGGKLTDKFGFYNIQLIALVGGGIMFLLLGRMQSFPAVCITTFFLSFINESFRPANAAAIAHYSKPENRTRSYSLNRLAINLGWAVGGAMGGFIAAKNYHLLFWIDGLTNIAAAGMLRFALSPSKNTDTPSYKTQNKVKVTKSAYRDTLYLAFIFLVIMFAFCFFQLFSTLPVYYNKKLHLGEAFIGITNMINGILIVLFEMILIHHLEKRNKTLHYISIGMVLTGVAFVIFNFIPGGALLAIVSMLIMTMGEMLSMPFMNTFWISRTDDTNRGQYAGLYTISWSLAQIIGPATGAQIAEIYGFRTLWWFIGAFSVAAAIGFKWLDKKTQSRPENLMPAAKQ